MDANFATDYESFRREKLQRQIAWKRSADDTDFADDSEGICVHRRNLRKSLAAEFLKAT